MRLSIILLLVFSLVSGTAVAESYDKKISPVISAVAGGNIETAMRKIESQTEGSAKSDLLLNLEKGEVMRIGTRYQDSLAAFDVADTKVKEWEDTARNNPAKLMGNVGAVILGDGSRTYEGQDYEKVMLTTRMALNRMNLGDFDTARVDIKRTHEREGVIAEFRAKETAQAEEQAKEKGIQPGGKELNGYPVETLNDPEVLKLKNGYQNALSHYLSGFVYEALNEPGLAAPGYRKAIELRPDVPQLEEGLRGLDQRTSFRRKKGVTDVLFIIEAGTAPARKSKNVSFVVPTHNGNITVSLTFPVIYPDQNAVDIDHLQLGKQDIPVALITDFNAMARRALKDELPGMQMRAAMRAIGKGFVQDKVNKSFGPFGGLISNIAAAALEPDADDRMWRTLPEQVFIARAFVPPGEYELHLPGDQENVKKVTVGGRYMVVPVRIVKDNTYFGETAQYGELPPVAVQPEPEADKPAIRKVALKGKKK